ncbi:U3 small nucleolar RNA-associated protein 7 [Nematocida sp. AWRm80]|nr:U3 small nucleolar RNA-associated protein 7 [Nematocida sp. AWRm80]
MSFKKHQQNVQKKKEAYEKYSTAKDKYDILNTTSKGTLSVRETVTTDDIEDYLNEPIKEKAYKLHMEKGPYKVRYTPSGDSMLCVGKTEVKTVNTQTLNAEVETELYDDLYDGTYLHSNAFYALAQSKAVYIYDRDGVELHVLRSHVGARALTFLQDHFLLTSFSDRGMLRYHDTTIGKLVSEISTKERGIAMTHDRSNGVVYLAGASGHISLWTPRTSEYLSKVLCHKSRVNNIQVSENGSILYTTAGGDLSQWDIRNMFQPLSTESYGMPITSLTVSQTGLIALASRNRVNIINQQNELVLSHHTARSITHSLSFMPYEDVLTIGTIHGIENIIVPGAGQELYRRHENPKASKTEKKNAEIRRILEKIPADMIALENETATEVKELFKEEILPQKLETPAGKVRRLMKIHYG